MSSRRTAFRLFHLFAFSSSILSLPVFADAQEKEKKPNETIAFFESGAIPELKLVINEEGQQRLREAPRDYTRCTLIENGTTTLKSIGVKLKGAAGSYQEIGRAHV